MKDYFYYATYQNGTEVHTKKYSKLMYESVEDLEKFLKLSGCKNINIFENADEWVTFYYGKGYTDLLKSIYLKG